MDWYLKPFALLLLTGGGLLLLKSLFQARALLQNDHGNLGWWRFLVACVVLFIAGYAGYGMGLLNETAVRVVDVVTSGVFFGGGVFVMLVMRMSVQTAQYVQHLSTLERHRSLHDGLTNLPNRRLLMERIDLAIDWSLEQKKPVAILIMDLNRFKEVNDTLGHHYGDRLLVEMALRLQNALKPNDMVARLGGDEFGFVLENVSADGAVDVSKHLLELVDKPFIVEGHGLSVGGSIGIAIFPEHGEEPQSLMQHADVAMYEAKRHGKGYALYEAVLDQYSLNRLKIVTSLRSSALLDQLSIMYQPKIDLTNGRVCGLEALVRWEHPTLGPIPPDYFIPVAERTGVMKQITFWVLRNVLKQIEEWQTFGLHIEVAVNLSVRNLSDDSLPREIGKALDAYCVPLSSIVLEVTESSMMVNPRLAHDVLNKLHALGLQFSIDDFGTGYSSLAYLKSLPASEIKIDKSFVLDMIHDESDAVIVHSTIALAHNMGYRVVAEGVESAEVLELLQVLGCDVAQGFYFSEPMSGYRVPIWVEQHNQNRLSFARAG